MQRFDAIPHIDNVRGHSLVKPGVSSAKQNNLNHSPDLSRSEISFKDLQTVDQTSPQDQENSPLKSPPSSHFYSPLSQLTAQLNPVPSASATLSSGFVRRSRIDGKEGVSPFQYLGPLDGYIAKETSPKLSEGMKEISWSTTNISHNIVAKSIQAVEDAQVTLDGKNSQIELELRGLKLYELEKKLDNCLLSSKNILDLNSKLSPRVSQIMSQSVRRTKVVMLQNDYEKVTRGYCSISPQKSSPYSIRTSVNMNEKLTFDEITKSIGKQERQKLLSLENEHNKMRSSLHKDSFRENRHENSSGKENINNASPPSKRLSLSPQRGIASVKKPKALGKAVETQNYYLPMNPEFRVSVENASPKNRERNDSATKEGFSDISEISVIATYSNANENKERNNKPETQGKDEEITKNFNNDTTLPTLENVDIQRDLEKSHEQKAKMTFKRDWSIETSQEHSTYESAILGKESIKKEIESFLMKFESEAKREHAKQWLKGIIENKEEEMSHLELRFLNIETEESKQTPTFQGKSEISLKDILKDEKKMTSQNSNKELIQKNSTFKLQSEVSKNTRNSKLMNSEKSPKRLFTLRPQKSYNNKDVETRSQTNFDTGKITQGEKSQPHWKRRSQRTQGEFNRSNTESLNMRLTRSPEKTHRSYNDLDKIQAQQKSEAASIQPLKTNEFKRKKIEAVNKSRTNEEGINKGNKYQTPVPNMVKSLEFLENLRKDVERSINYIDKSLQDFEETESLPNNSLEMKSYKSEQENIWGNVTYKEAKSAYLEGEALEDTQSPKTQGANSRTFDLLARETNSKGTEERTVSEQDEFITDEYHSLKFIEEAH